MFPKYVVKEYDGDKCVYNSDPMKLENAHKIARRHAADWSLPTEDNWTWRRNYCPIRVCIVEWPDTYNV